MSYKSDFENASGWSIADTNIKLNTPRGKQFRDYLKQQNVKAIIRYYASTRRAKTLSLEEAKVISSDGFSIIPVYQDRNRTAADFGRANGKKSAQNALDFAAYIGQPHGSTILFAVDSDFRDSEVTNSIIPYFRAIKETIDNAALRGLSTMRGSEVLSADSY